MAEDGKFADGYEAIFGKKQSGAKATKKPADVKKSAGKAVAKKTAKKK